jgi:poly(hydroxyalkanoate) depolymerase family esterase
MNKLKNWLQRLASSDQAHAASARASGIDIGKTINDALTAAGLQGPPADARSSADTPPGVATVSVLAPVARPAQAKRVAQAEGVADGHGLIHRFANDAGTRTYAVHLPSAYDRETDAKFPLLVMLHGCTQSIADFAVGTQMNALAERLGFIVVYPEQPGSANASRCWNWFRTADQKRGQGEPSLIAGIAQEVCARYRGDPQRVFVAGLSAGGAMAVVVGDAYPDVFAAVAAHSGLRLGAAHDVASAFTAMKCGPVDAARTASSRLTPTLVFQGDADRTVSAKNATAIIEDVLSSAARAGLRIRTDSTTVSSVGRKAARRTVYTDDQGRPVAEHWLVAGGGHAWSGGDERGTYTDVAGPCASDAIVRFFGLGDPLLAP